MQAYWTCSNCGSANAYPQEQRCEVCDKEMDEAEKKQAEHSLEEAEAVRKRFEEEERKAQEKIKRQKEEEEKKRILAEKLREKKRLEEEERERQRIKRVELARKLEKANQAEMKVVNVVVKFMKFAKIAMIILVVAGTVLTGYSVFAKYNPDNISVMTKNMLSYKLNYILESHLEPDGFEPFEKISNEFKEIVEHFKESDNIEKIFEYL